MGGISEVAGKWMKTRLAALGAAALSVPMVGALAAPVDPTQQLAEEAAAAGLTDEQKAEAKDLFGSWSCSTCHALSEAGGYGHIGPSLDGNDAMDEAFIISRIANGQGAMPGFGGQMSDEEIALVATYIMEVKK